MDGMWSVYYEDIVSWMINDLYGCSFLAVVHVSYISMLNQYLSIELDIISMLMYFISNTDSR